MFEYCVGRAFCLVLILTNSYQITETNPIPIQLNIWVEERLSKPKNVVKEGTKSSNPMMAVVMAITSSTKLFLYLKVVKME